MNEYENNNNVAYINGRRGSNNVVNRINSNIENRIVVNRNKPRNNNNQNVIDEIVVKLRDKINNKPIRVYNNPNNVRINNNNSKPRVYNRVENSNNNTPPRIYTRPSSNNVVTPPKSVNPRGKKGGND